MYEMVTVAGSSRFKDHIRAAAARLTLQGSEVYAPSIFEHADDLALSPKERAMLWDMHDRMSAAGELLYVVAPGNYVGTATRRLIAHAKERGTRILIDTSPTPRKLRSKDAEITGIDDEYSTIIEGAAL